MTGDAFFCDKPWALGRGRSQSIVALENVNGTSLKGTPLPGESDYRITGVEAERTRRVLEIATRTMSCKILTGVNHARYWWTRVESHKELEDVRDIPSRVNRVHKIYNLNKDLFAQPRLPRAKRKRRGPLRAWKQRYYANDESDGARRSLSWINNDISRTSPIEALIVNDTPGSIARKNGRLCIATSGS